MGAAPGDELQVSTNRERPVESGVRRCREFDQAKAICLGLMPSQAD